MRKSKTHSMTLCALFAALTAVLSQIAIPIGPVPINLATFAVFCAGAILGSKLGALSLVLWAAIGAAGMPVFTMFRGGLGALVGPTGGFIIGYMPAAFLTGLIIEKLGKNGKVKEVLLFPIAMIAGMLTYFTLGTAWFAFSTGTGLVQSLMVCVVPFLPGDFIKIAAATIVSIRMRHILHTARSDAADEDGDNASKRKWVKRWPIILIAVTLISISIYLLMYFFS